MLCKSSYSLWIAIPVLTTLNQACIKLLAAQTKEIPFGWEWMAQAVQTPWAIGIFLCEVLSFALWLTILSSMDISKAAPITAVAYIAIMLMSWTVFEEPVMALQIIGGVLIMTGVWCIGTASPSAGHEKASG
jgi:drug/metabolite transporter (DMT)-like permease